MKRGLVVLDPAEVPEDEWRARTEGVRRRMAEEGVDVALVYGDVFASDDIAYLTNLCVYWNEGVLAVPAEGPPVFLTKLSPRVHPWMRRTSVVERIESGRSFGALVTRVLGELPSGTVGLVDAERWPAAVADEVREALPGLRVRELPGLVRAGRAVVSAHELALLREGGAVVARAADAAGTDGLGVRARTATVERVVRGAGFLDVQVNVPAAPDGVVTVQVTGQYRTGWLHVSRLVGGAPWTGALRGALEAAVAAVRPGVRVTDLNEAAAPALKRLPEGTDARVSLVNQTDLASGGEHLGPRAAEPPAAGAVVALTVDVLFGTDGYAAVAETVLVTAGGCEVLTGASVRNDVEAAR
ncbi:aminopeptidase P family N-terminal domain-containing protein [Streptomyces sp. NPDC026672]|uniref:aminopeptidase P family N-terminal domain-containing protein n=1 Tax=unclassified Streptomyces TaxID=2593676 RepID=UPI0033E2E67B